MLPNWEIAFETTKEASLGYLEFWAVSQCSEKNL